MKNGAVTVKNAAGQEVTKQLIPIDEADTAIRDLNRGTNIKRNQAVEDIFKYQPTVNGKKKYTRRDIWNKYFESIGTNIQIPPDSVSYTNQDLENLI